MQQWNNIWVVTVDELVPAFYKLNALQQTIHRYSDKPYGIKRVQLGGNGRQMLIAYDSLPAEIKTALGDPRKISHPLERHYRTDGKAVSFFTDFRFEDGTALSMEYQEKYVVNANMIQALFALKFSRETERLGKGATIRGVMRTLCEDAISFQEVLKVKHHVQHTLPENERRFKDCLNEFEKEGYSSLISKRHKNNNALKVTDATLALLNNMFAKNPTKPTATEVHRQYKGFMLGFVEVINSSTGELYNPADFKELSESTVTNYMSQWVNRIGNHAARSGDRQRYMQQFKPHHSLNKPQFAGSIISIDDRQPPFKCLDGRRVWFYNGIDLGSEAFTCWVYGKDKEGLILNFYRQLIRNYHEWGMNLPAELEAEMSLNSSFVSTFLREGSMFEYVRIEANNARGKRIEAYYRPLRYELEKKREGWLARPFALSESNQGGADKVPELPFETIIDGCLQDIETWNNMPHSVHKDKTRWQVFMEMQNPNLKPTNYLAILPFLGWQTKTSCNVGSIKLQGKRWLLGENGTLATGESLINLMRRVEGRDITVYWLDGNDGELIKAMVFIGDLYICEAIADPSYQRARIEQTPLDSINRELMSKYVATIEAFGRKQKSALDQVTIIDNTPKPEKTFVMPDRMKQAPMNEATSALRQLTGEMLPDPEEEDEELVPVPANNTRKSLKDRY